MNWIIFQEWNGVCRKQKSSYCYDIVLYSFLITFYVNISKNDDFFQFTNLFRKTYVDFDVMLVER